MPDLQFYKCWADHQDPKVPEKALLDWWCTPDKQYHCIFCGTHGSESHFLRTWPLLDPIMWCTRCKEYKGIEPCIPGYCIFGEE